jgi:hypothetical protein
MLLERNRGQTTLFSLADAPVAAVEDELDGGGVGLAPFRRLPAAS